MQRKLNFFTRHIPKQREIDILLKITHILSLERITLYFFRPNKSLKGPSKSIAFCKQEQHSYMEIDVYRSMLLLLQIQKITFLSIIYCSNSKTTQASVPYAVFPLVIPESFEPLVLRMYHDTLLAGHFRPFSSYCTFK